MEKNTLDDFAKVSMSTYNLEKLNLDYAAVIKALSSEIKLDFEVLNRKDTKTARFNFFNIPDTKEEDYTEYLVKILDKGYVIGGIRHFNSQPEEPFVNMLTSFKLSDTEELLELYKAFFSEKLGVFKPQYIRYYSSKKIESDRNGIIYLVQESSTIKSKVKFEKEDEIDLVIPEATSYYDWYAREYKIFHQANPTLVQSVPMNTKDLMEESRRKGLLRVVKFQEETIGLIAALPTEFLGRKGICFIEILIKERWRNRGLGKAIQRKYIDSIKNADEIVWGTIDANNEASLNTALANSRMEIRYENFIKIGV